MFPHTWFQKTHTYQKVVRSGSQHRSQSALPMISVPLGMPGPKALSDIAPHFQPDSRTRGARQIGSKHRINASASSFFELLLSR